VRTGPAGWAYFKVKQHHENGVQLLTELSSAPRLSLIFKTNFTKHRDQAHVKRLKTLHPAESSTNLTAVQLFKLFPQFNVAQRFIIA
jgi:hypothetical protein